MTNLHKYISITTAILFLVLSGNAMAINKCVNAAGETSFTDKPCPAGSTADTVKLRTEHHASAAKTSASPSSHASKANDSNQQANSKQPSSNQEGWKKRWPTKQAYAEYYCSHDANRTRTPKEMLADAKAVANGDLPTGSVCCRNNKPVACK